MSVAWARRGHALTAFGRDLPFVISSIQLLCGGRLGLFNFTGPPRVVGSVSFSATGHRSRPRPPVSTGRTVGGVHNDTAEALPAP